MRKIGSVWMAAARNLWWKLLLILAAMTAVELGLFQWAISGEDYVWYYGSRIDRYDFALLVEQARLQWVFFGAVAAVAACCCLQGCRFSGKNVYTLRRLPVAEWQITAWWFPVHLCCFVILWAAQLAVIFLLWRLFCQNQAPAAPGLELLTCLYRCGFLHGLLPLADWTRWLAVGSYWVCFGWLTASFGFFQRRGRFRIGAPAALGSFRVLTLNMGSSGVDVTAAILLWLAVGISVCSIWGVYHEETET